MEKPASVLFKEIRDSAEHATNLMQRLQKIRVDSEWNLILGGPGDLTLREWNRALRELDGHLIAIRDQYFAHIAQATMSREPLKELSRLVDRTTSSLQLVVDQLSSLHGPYKASRINALTMQLSRHSDGIHQALRRLTDELHDHVGTRPTSRYSLFTRVQWAAH